MDLILIVSGNFFCTVSCFEFVILLLISMVQFYYIFMSTSVVLHKAIKFGNISEQIAIH